MTEYTKENAFCFMNIIFFSVVALSGQWQKSFVSWRCENFYSSCPKVPKSPKGDDQGNLWNLNSCLQIMGIHFFTGWWCFSIESISVMDSIIDFEQSLSVCEMWVCDQWSCKQQVVWVPVPAKRKTALAHIIHVHFWKWYLVSNFSRESIKVIKVWNMR